MADLTYQPLVYMKQGSTELVIASSGLATIESGGSLDVQSGGGIDVQSGGDITVEDGGKIIYPVTGCTSSSIGSTTLTTLPADGLSIVMTTAAAGQRLLYLTAPYKGASKYIHFIDGSTGVVVYIDTQTAGATVIQSTGTGSTMGLIIWEGTTNDAPPAMIHLVGLSTTRWVALEMHPATGFTFASTSS
jgi:hypothetical protein